MTTDGDEEDLAHNTLMEEIRKINSADRKKSKRSLLKNVRVTRVSELSSNKLSGILSKVGGGTKKKQLQPLIEPLEKPQAKRLQREAGFEHVAVEANKWNCIVEERKKADQLHFPLEKVDVRVITSEKNYKPPIKTELEKEVYGLLNGVELDDEEESETEEEKNIKKAMSLKEIRERSQKIMKDRNLRLRLERKVALINKSKSKKYHRILRRERVKRKKEEFEILKATKPEEALKVLDELEKTRIKERMNLRHKKSKWIVLQQSRAPHDNRVRDMLRENKELREELLGKVKLQEQSDVENDDDEDSDTDEKDKLMDVMKHQAQDIKDGKFDSQNLWVSQLAVPDPTDSAPDESFYKMKKFWEARNQEKLRELEAMKVVKEYEEKQKKTKCDEKEEEVEENEAEVNEKDEEEIESEAEEEFKKFAEPSEKIQKSDKDKIPKNKKQIETEKKSKLKVSTIKKKKVQKIKKDGNKNKNKETKHEIQTRKTNSDANEQTNIVNIKENCSVQVKEVRKENINKNCDKNLVNKSTIQNNLTLTEKEIRSKEKETCNEPEQNFIKIVDRNMGNTKHDIGFLKKILNNEDSDSEKEDLTDIFDDEDYVKEFAEEKKEHEENRKIKDIDNFKAGWGSWGGPGIVVSEEKRSRFIIKAPKVAPNKYSHIGNVIYKEKSDLHENLRKNLVSELPFPFTSVKDFEASVRQPIGRTFVPEVSHKKLIAPPVVQKMGTVIEPMGEECLVKNYESHKRKETELEKELNEKLENVNGRKKQKTFKEVEDNKRRKANKKKKKKSRAKQKPFIFI